MVKLYSTDFQIFIQENKLKKNYLAEFLGVSNAFITQLAQGLRDIPEEKLALIKANKEWNSSMLDSPKRVMHPINDGCHYVPLLPIAAQGGSLNDFIMSVKTTDCEKIVSPINGTDFAMVVNGDSMAPEYPSGSQVLIKRINERAFIEWGKVYVLDTCNGTIIKKIMPYKESNKIVCISINPEYPPFEVDTQDIYGMYKVLLCMSIK